MTRFFYLLLFLSNLFFAQKIPKSSNVIFFKDGKSKLPILIVDDSLLYKGNLKNPIKLRSTKYPESLSNYNYHFIIKGTTYLVHDGCGPVLEFRNDSIVRIDNSFLQKNQYGASSFNWKNSICLFGGYGLFTNKNIITNYNLNLNEWVELYTKDCERPLARNNSKSIVVNNKFYVFGGYINERSPVYINDKKIWSLDLNEMKWDMLGFYNDNIYKVISKPLVEFFDFQANNKLYHFTRDNIYEIDVVKNRVNYFKNNSFQIPYKMFYDPDSDQVISLVNLSAKNEFIIQKQLLKSLIVKPYKTEQLYGDGYEDVYTFIIIIVIILVTLLILLRRKKYSNKHNYFVFNKKNNKFYYNSKPVVTLESLEEKILIFLFQNKDRYTQLNELNVFFESEHKDNYSLIVKRRDLLFNSLLFKLSSLMNIEISHVVIKQKNEIDKRIREIRLNPLYFKSK